MRPLVTGDEMRVVEQRFVDAGGDLDWLMRQAGMQVASRVPPGKAVLILAGPGNNGGDALVAGSILRERGDRVHVYTYKRAGGSVPDAVVAEDDTDQVSLTMELQRADVLIDGLLGIGRRRPIEGALRHIIEAANAAPAHRIAVDLPTGVDADSGDVETVAFRAHVTVTLGFGKRGLWGTAGAMHSGVIEIADIGLPPGSAAGANCVLLDQADIRPLLPRRTNDWNKGKSGRVLVISGSARFPGAPSLVGMAAYRAGAGLVDMAVPLAIKPVVAGRLLESVFTAVVAGHELTPESVPDIAAAVADSDAVALGPGLGSADQTHQAVRQLLPLLKAMGKPLLLDADGLNAVAQWDSWWKQLPPTTVLTPHPGEMGRLLGTTTSDVQRDRFAAARNAADRWNCVVVLKGSNTIVAGPGHALRVCPLGGPNLAVGGTGDVLTGIVASYLGQGLDPLAAATAGAWVHAAAGDELRSELGDTGTVATDLWDRIPRIQSALAERTD
jgi:hydroxyethylthiazole kinase-like uncharacterized protein yjeF